MPSGIYCNNKICHQRIPLKNEVKTEIISANPKIPHLYLRSLIKDTKNKVAEWVKN